jgi:hypothetical protein
LRNLTASGNLDPAPDGSTMNDTNPFDDLELDPRLDPDQLTDALRRRAERADPEERQRIRELWRRLTVNERDRVRWAFFAHPRPSEADPRSIETLREKVPPVVLRGKPVPIVPTVADALTFTPPDLEVSPGRVPPPSLFEDE